MNYDMKIELSEDLFSALRTNPSEFVSEMRLAAAVKWYELGRISQSKASEIAGLSRQEFMEALNRYEVSPFQTNRSEMLKEAGSGK